MPRRPRRASIAPRPEPLEDRRLLSAATATTSWITAEAKSSTSLLARFRAGTPAAVETAAVERAGASVIARYPGGTVLLGTASPSSRAAALKSLGRAKSVVYAEPNRALRASAVYPSDPGLYRQWGLDNPTNVDIDAPEAWGTTTGRSSTVVAVIDSGLDVNHPEFAGRLWTNAREANGRPGLDDDGNGLVDDRNGWNFYSNTPNVSDDNGHGTHITGILAASGNNSLGLAGVDWNARIMPLKFIGADGNGSVDDAVRAVYYAVNQGARVINASWGGGARVRALTDAIAYANSRNVVFVTAAGNEGVNNGVRRSYPANERQANVLSVAAVDSAGNLASFSNYGATTVDLAAPGVNIRSTYPGGYATFSGTSMAAPYVAGVASLVIGLHPELTAAQVVRRVINTAKPLVGLRGRLIAPGIVDAANAVSDAYAAAQPWTTSTRPGRRPRPYLRRLARWRIRPAAPKVAAAVAAPPVVEWVDAGVDLVG